MQFEIARMAGVRRFPASLDIKVCFVFLVRKTGQAQNPRRISGGGISAEFACHGVQKSFRLVETQALHLPDDLEFPRRTGQDIIWFRDRAGVFNGCDGFRPAVI